MELPGIRQKMIEDLEPKFRKVINRHVKELKEIVKEKERILDTEDPKEELLGLGGFKKIDKFVIKVEGPLEEKLLTLKQDMQELKEAIDREINLMKNIDELTKAGKKDKILAEQLERLKEELSDPLLLAKLLLEQTDNIKTGHSTIADIVRMAKKQEEQEIAVYATELDNLISKIQNVIQTRETDALDLIHNLLHTEGWNEIENELRL